MALPTPTDNDRKFAESQLERAKLQAAAYLPQLLEILAEKSLDPSATAKNVLDSADFMFRVSGLAKKTEDQQQGAKVVVNINMGRKTITVENAPVHEATLVEEQDDFAVLDTVVPEALKPFTFTDDLTLDLDD